MSQFGPHTAWKELLVNLVIGLILVALFIVQILLLVDANKSMEQIKATQQEQMKRVERNTDDIEENREIIEESKEIIDKINKINLFDSEEQYARIRNRLQIYKPYNKIKVV